MAEPMTRAERVAKRTRIRDEYLAAAEITAVGLGLSLKCRGYQGGTPRHASEVGGCANTGETCLCACHDPKGDDRG